MKKEIIINNIESTKSLAEAIYKYVFPGFLLCLEGDLGAGKTTFTKFFGKELGIEDVINSPTFTILKVYEGELAVTAIAGWVYIILDTPYSYLGTRFICPVILSESFFR